MASSQRASANFCWFPPESEDTGNPVSATAVTTPTSCPTVNDGTITVTPPAGAGNIVYTLTPGNIIQNNNPIFTGLASGVYTINFTTQAGCGGTVSPNPFVGLGLPLTSTATLTNPPCANINDGILTIIPSAPGNYTYTLNPGTPGQVVQVNNALRKGTMKDRNLYMGNDINNKTIGIVGLVVGVIFTAATAGILSELFLHSTQANTDPVFNFMFWMALEPIVAYDPVNAISFYAGDSDHPDGGLLVNLAVSGAPFASIGVQHVRALASHIVVAQERVREASCAVAAHFGGRAITVIELHSGVQVVHSLKQQQPIRPDPRGAVAPLACGTRPVGLPTVIARTRGIAAGATHIRKIEHEEVVAPGVVLAHSHR